MTSLPLQCPIVATLLALIFRCEPDFCATVLEKLQAALVRALADDEALTAKLALRALAVLAEGGVSRVCARAFVRVSVLSALISVFSRCCIFLASTLPA